MMLACGGATTNVDPGCEAPDSGEANRSAQVDAGTTSAPRLESHDGVTYDSLLSIDCSFNVDEFGDQRCLPVGPTFTGPLHLFSDPQCSLPVVEVKDLSVEYVLVNAYGKVSVYELPGNFFDGDHVFSDAGGGCLPAEHQTNVRQATSVDPDQFASAMR